jgi:putative (di)nucleoside polyphosphate hydrolase
MSNKAKSLPLRPNVCMLVLNQEQRIFVGEREGSPGVWQFPQGGAETNTPLEENVLRELHEELGAEKSRFRIIKKLTATNEYDFSDPPGYAIGKWRGQAQTFWLVEFLGTDADFKLDRYDQEFSDFRWCTIQEVRQLAEPKRLRGYEAALKELEELER